MTSKPLFEKYRPIDFENLMLDKNTEILFNGIRKNPKSMPNLIFHGPPGTGKTSSMMNLLKGIFGSNRNNYVIELNASDERSIKTVREPIRGFCETKNNFIMNREDFNDYKVVVLDEVDSMTSDAQFCLRRMMETHVHGIRFILICNYLSKIISALRSRCCSVKFKQLNYDNFNSRLNQITDLENMNISGNNMKFVCHICEGDMRKVLNLVQNLKNFNKFDENSIVKYTGYPSIKIIKKILQIIENDNNNNKQTLKLITNIKDKNKLNIINIIKELFNYVIKIDFNNDDMRRLIQGLSDIENNYYFLMDSQIALMNIISLFGFLHCKNPNVMALP